MVQGVWTQVGDQDFVSDDQSKNSHHGTSIAMSGTNGTIFAVGAPLSSGAHSGGGSAVVYRESSSK